MTTFEAHVVWLIPLVESSFGTVQCEKVCFRDLLWKVRNEPSEWRLGVHLHKVARRRCDGGEGQTYYLNFLAAEPDLVKRIVGDDPSS